LGEEVETLEDLLAPNLRAVCVGINPSVVSVEGGHYYQGRLGQAFYRRLQRVGLFPQTFEGFEDDALFERGVGFTDIIKRPTARASELSPADYEHGRARLVEKLGHHRPKMVIFTFKKTAEVLLGKFAGHGEKPSPVEGVRFFVMPGPYATTSVATSALVTLQDLLN